MLNFKDNFGLKGGFINIVIKNKHTGEITFRKTLNNLITYGAATIAAKAYAGDSKYHITHIYGEHVLSGGGYVEGSLNGMAALQSDTVDVLRAGTRLTEHTENAIITPSYYTSNDAYYNNVVTFTASWDGENLAGHLMQGAGLVAQVNNIEHLCAHAYFKALPIQTDEEMICHWSQLFI